MSRASIGLLESVVAKQDSSQRRAQQSTSTSDRLNREASPRERKRIQNRNAQRTYRRNQKEKMQALEAVVGGSLGTVASSSTTNCPRNDGDLSALSDPSCDDQIWSIEPLLNDSSPPGILPGSGRTALHRAVCNKNEAIVRLLLERGANIVKQDSYGQTALHLAVESGCEGLVKLLLERITDPNMTDAFGRTALFAAVQTENETIAKLLLDASVDVNWRDSLGDVALHIAVERGSEALTLLLLTNGANIDA